MNDIDVNIKYKKLETGLRKIFNEKLNLLLQARRTWLAYLTLHRDIEFQTDR
jgi:hypothetical protein